MSEKAHVFLNWQTQIHRLFHISRLPFDLVRLIWLFFFLFFFLITQSSQCNCPLLPLFINLKGHKLSLRHCQRLRPCCPTGNTLRAFWLKSELYLVPREATICGTCAFFKFININFKRAQVNSSQWTPPPLPLFTNQKRHTNYSIFSRWIKQFLIFVLGFSTKYNVGHLCFFSL